MKAINSIAAACLLTVLTGPAMAAVPTDTMLWTPGQITLVDGQSDALAQTKGDERYRVCVAQKGHNVPLKVLDGDKATLLAPGQCKTFDGTSLRVAAPHRVPGDDQLIVTYDR